MVQGYYTLAEACKFLTMPEDELKRMAQKGQIRYFQDRGTMRFRVQDIQELARVRGIGSDPDLALGEATAPPKSGSSPSSARRKAQLGPKTPTKQANASAPDVFAFNMDDDSVDLGAPLPTTGSGPKGSKLSPKPKKGPASPAPVGSDSDVRLVADGSDVTFSVPKDAPAKLADSEVKIAPDPLAPKSGTQPPSSGKRAVGSGASPKPASGATPPVNHPSPPPGGTVQPPDSGVRLVMLDSDSDVKLVGISDDVPLGIGSPSASSDSNVRLDKVSVPPADSAEGSMMLTDEIDLDAELKRQEEKAKKDSSTKVRPKQDLKLPSTSPFELSDSDVPMPPELRKRAGPKTPKQGKAAPSDSSDFDMAAHGPGSGSSDFDLVPASDGSILLESEPSDFSLEISDEHEQVLQSDATTELTKSTSGISLNNPVDAGISLEQGSDQTDDGIDFDLSLDIADTPKPAKKGPVVESGKSGQKTPKPKKKPVADDVGGSSEFELSLGGDSDGEAPALSGSSDSEFELNLDSGDEVAAGSPGDSDSEFELTLDDSSQLDSIDESSPQVKAKAGAGSDQDIFETDFEVPALDDSDDATAADSELESSDFDLALDDSELAQEEESGSQVVALDEEEATEAGDAAVVDDVEVEGEGSEFKELDEDVDAEDVEVEEDEAPVGKERVVIKKELIPPAPWGVMPVIFMLPCVIVMFLVGILGFELVQSTANLKPPGLFTTVVADAFNLKVSLK